MTELFGCFQATTFHCYQNSMTYTTTPTLRETEAHNSSAEKPELKQRLFSLTLNFLSMFVLSLSNYLTVNITLWPLDAHMSRGLISSLQYWHYLDYLIMKQAITFNSTHWKCTHFRVNVNTWWSVPLSNLPPHLSLPMPFHCPQAHGLVHALSWLTGTTARWWGKAFVSSSVLLIYYGEKFYMGRG